MGRLWDSVFLSGLFILAFLLVILLYRPAPGPRDAFIGIDTQLSGASGEVKVAKPRISLNDQGHLDNFPRTIGDWRGTDDKAAGPFKKSLQADVLLLRTYVKDRLSQPLLLLIIHSPRSGSFHAPPVCYRAQGYSIGESSKDTIYVNSPALGKQIDEYSSDTTGEPGWNTVGEWLAIKLSPPVPTVEIPVNKLIVSKTDKNKPVERRLVFYFYLNDLEFVSRQEFSMLRVEALIPLSGNYDSVEREMKDFIGEVLPLIFESYGEEKEMVIGYIAGLGLKGYLVLGALFLAPLAMVIYPLATGKLFNWRKSREATEQESGDAEKIIDQPEASLDTTDEAPSVTQPLSLPFDLSGKSGNDKILGAYYNSQWIIEKATDVTVASCPTLRDFLNKVIPRLPTETGGHFAELTRMTEAVMYSGAEPGERAVTRAGQLVEEIARELHTTGRERR